MKKLEIIIVLNLGRFNKKLLKNDNSKYKDFLISLFDFNSLDEFVYIVKNRVFEKPKCPTCGKQLEYSVSKGRYKFHCNSSCAASDKNVIIKRQNTNIKLYGSVNNHKKQKETMLRKYSVESALSFGELRDKGIKTKLEKYRR